MHMSKQAQIIFVLAVVLIGIFFLFRNPSVDLENTQDPDESAVITPESTPEEIQESIEISKNKSDKESSEEIKNIEEEFDGGAGANQFVRMNHFFEMAVNLKSNAQSFYDALEDSNNVAPLFLESLEESYNFALLRILPSRSDAVIKEVCANRASEEHFEYCFVNTKYSLSNSEHLSSLLATLLFTTNKTNAEVVAFINGESIDIDGVWFDDPNSIDCSANPDVSTECLLAKAVYSNNEGLCKSFLDQGGYSEYLGSKCLMNIYMYRNDPGICTNGKIPFFGEGEIAACKIIFGN